MRNNTRMLGNGSAVLIITILVLGTIAGLAPKAAEAQQKVPGANWPYVNGEKLSTNFSPQTQITKDNVKFVELGWIFPIPTAPELYGGYTTAQGALAQPLIVDGIVYIVTKSGTAIAIDAAKGKTLWTLPMQVNKTTDLAGRKLYTTPTSVPTGTHGFSYFEGKLYIQAPPCDLHIIDALTGKLIRKQAYMCDAAGIEGIAPDQPLGRGYKAVQSYGPMFYEKGRLMIVPDGPVSEDNSGGRGFFSAYNVDTGQRVWRFYVTPPHGGDKDWAIRDADKGWIQGIKTSEILRVCRECLENDWGKNRWVQAGPAWGQHVVDEETGIAYVATAQASPDWNATYRPGPNLFSSSVLAVDAMTGKLIWYHQTTTHDLWDYDCAWSLAMGKIGDKKVVYKGCKNGIMYAFDTKDGSIVWSFNPPAIKRTYYVPFWDGSKLNSGPKDNSLIGNWDPRNIRTMTLPWQNYPDTAPYFQNPPGTGGIESDITLAYGNVYVATYNAPGYLRSIPVEGPPRATTSGNQGLPAPYTPRDNTTIYALDATTGRVKWSYFIPDVGFRGGLVATGGMVLAPAFNGNLYALDAENGNLLWTKYLGNPLAVAPSMGADASGKIKIFVLFGGTSTVRGAGPAVPGALIALGLPDQIPTKEVVREVVKEVPKEVIKEVPKEVIKEVIKEVPKEVVKEVIKEVPKEVTKTVTVETIGPVTYAAIGVAVVALVISGVVFSRRKSA